VITELAVQAASPTGLRPFDIGRDVAPLAELIEIAFDAELARTGNDIVEELRRLSRSGPLLKALAAVISPPLGGFVWEQDGRVIGNATISQSRRRRDIWEVSNVAVLPSHRRKGIASALVRAALAKAASRGARWIVLEVQTQNAAAQSMYRALGFSAVDTVAELRLSPLNARPVKPAPTVALRRRTPHDWTSLRQLSTVTTPQEMRRIWPAKESELRQSFFRSLVEWVGDWLGLRSSEHWVAEQDDAIVAALHCRYGLLAAAHHLRMQVHPDRRGLWEPVLVAFGVLRLHQRSLRDIKTDVSTSHPEALQAFNDAGFVTVRLLDQMVLELETSARETER